MGPPPVGGKDKGKDKAATTTKRPAPATPPAAPAAKRRKDVETAAAATAGASSPQTNGINGLAKEAAVEPDEGEGEAGDDDDAAASWSWEWVCEDRDTRGELLAAVFAHITLGAIDPTPAVVQNPYTGPAGATAQNSTGRMGATMRASTARSGVSATATARSSSSMAGAGRPRTQGRNSSASAAAATPSSTLAGSSNIAKQPTIYALTNLRFPSTTAPALVTRYEDLSRDLFTLLGQRPHELVRAQPLASAAASKSTQAAPSDAAQRVCEILGRQDPEAGPLAFHLATIFASMLHVLEAATLTGPITALLKLISHLAFLSPLFAIACCGAEAINYNNGNLPAQTYSTQKKSANIAVAPTALISLVGHIVARYCRPAAPDPDSLSATGRDALAGSAVVRTRRPRITRSLGGRRTSSTSSATNASGSKKGNLDAPHRVDNLDPAKRVGLVAAALALLEGVAWRCLAIQTTTTTSSPLFTHVDMDVELATRLAEDSWVLQASAPMVNGS